MFNPNEPPFLEALKRRRSIWSVRLREEGDPNPPRPRTSSRCSSWSPIIWKYSDQTATRRRSPPGRLKLYSTRGLHSSLEGVGTALGKARDAYDDATKRLCTGPTQHRARRRTAFRRSGQPAVQAPPLAAHDRSGRRPMTTSRKQSSRRHRSNPQRHMRTDVFPSRKNLSGGGIAIFAVANPQEQTKMKKLLFSALVVLR